MPWRSTVTPRSAPGRRAWFRRSCGGRNLAALSPRVGVLVGAQPHHSSESWHPGARQRTSRGVSGGACHFERAQRSREIAPCVALTTSPSEARSCTWPRSRCPERGERAPWRFSAQARTGEGPAGMGDGPFVVSLSNHDICPERECRNAGPLGRGCCQRPPKSCTMAR